MPFIEAPTTFYLGLNYDAASGMIGNEVIYFGSQSLLNHAVLLGASGSGKSGLGAVLIEEALIDRIPVIVLDTKGDMSGLPLLFPGLSPEEFLPWVSQEAALNAGMDLATYAAGVAQQWREGLAAWEILPERLQYLRDNAHFRIYTPGANTGLPVNIEQMIAPPREGWLGHEDYHRERIASLVHALLTLLGRQTITPQDREYILLGYILEHFWSRSQMITLTDLVAQIQHPPFDLIAGLAIENFFPEEARQQFAYELNNVLVAPEFQSWRQGDPFSVVDLLYSADQRPNANIFSLVHLSPPEQAFFITFLLEQIRTWMLTQPTSASLRALVYIDEIFNFFPPYPYQPPTKTPILRLLKEAAPYGVGLMIGAQNAAMVDYKGLANTGTWFVGRLDSEADRQRVIEGLQVSNTVERQVDLQQINQLLATLPARVFLIDSIYNPGMPILMSVRWSMSYQRKALTPQQIQNVAEMQAPVLGYPMTPPPVFAAPPPPPSLPEMPPAVATLAPVAPVSVASTAATPLAGAPTLPIGYTYERPPIPGDVAEFFLPANLPITQAVDYYQRQNPHLPAVKPAQQFYLLYQPFLVAQCKVRYFEQAKYIDIVDTFSYHIYTLPSNKLMEWEQYRGAPIVRETISDTPYPQAAFGTPDPGMLDEKQMNALREEVLEYVYRSALVSIPANEMLQIYGVPGRPFQEFQAKLADAARSYRDQAIDQLAERYRGQLTDLENRYMQQWQKYQSDRAELNTAGQEFAINAAEMGFSFLTRGALLGVVSRIARLNGYRNRAETNVREDEQALALLDADGTDIQRRFDTEVQQLNEYWAQIAAQYTEMHIKPFRDDTYLEMFGVAWKPFYYVQLNQQSVILPAWQSQNG